MKILNFTYNNHLTSWNIKNINFSSLTLLVGASGVGKTQVLHALSNLNNIANGNSVNGAEWDVSFKIGDAEYEWSGTFETKENDYQVPTLFPNGQSEYNILSERLTNDEEIIVDRDTKRLKFLGEQTVKLDASKSVLSLLKEEKVISKVYNAFRRIYQLRNAESNRVTILASYIPFTEQESGMRIDDIKKMYFLTPTDKLYLLKSNKLPLFDEIESKFRSFFPLVEKIDFDMGNFGDNSTLPVLKIKEKDVQRWIYATDISSGMMRTLDQIVTLTTANDGDVILIDEFENGLGVNCIDSLAEDILDPDSDVQIIMTSHHPYIINNIPYSTWRVLTRNGSDVHVHTAEELGVGDWSKHDAFIQLCNTKAFKTGQA